VSAQVVELEGLLKSQRVWRGNAPQPLADDALPTGWPLLDEALPTRGWLAASLTELLIPSDGVGELELLWPALARLTAGDGLVALVAPPHLPYAPAWHAAGVRLQGLQVIRADPRDALWAAEQCLRSGACNAVVCWPATTDDRLIRRLQVAAENGKCRGFAIRPARVACNPSPAPVRLSIEPAPTRQIRVIKCRGANPPTRPVPFPRASR
jgi:hypothetical protein